MNWTGCVIILTSVLAGVGGIACDSDESSDGHNHNMADTGEGFTTVLSAETQGGHFFVKLAPPNGSAPFNELFSMGVSVFDNADQTQLLTDATIEIDAVMVTHNHGMNTTPVVEKQPDGTFVCNGMMFHMEGQWDVVVTVTHNQLSDTATLPYACCP